MVLNRRRLSILVHSRIVAHIHNFFEHARAGGSLRLEGNEDRTTDADFLTAWLGPDIRRLTKIIMSMESSIHEPFLLQSYTNSKRFQKAKALVYAAPAFSSTNNDGYVTVGAQADGIHILDVGFSFLLLKILTGRAV